MFSNEKKLFISHEPNHLLKLLRRFPRHKWDINRVSSNPNITWEIISTYKKFCWKWCYVNSNPNITPEIIRNNPDKGMSLDFLKEDESGEDESGDEEDRKYTSSLEYLIKQSITEKSTYSLSIDPRVTWDFVQKNRRNIKWHGSALSQNPNISINIILKYQARHPCTALYPKRTCSPITNTIVEQKKKEKLQTIYWNWINVSRNPNVTFKVVMNNLEQPWDFAELSDNKFLYDNIVYNKRKKQRINRRRRLTSCSFCNWY